MMEEKCKKKDVWRTMRDKSKKTGFDDAEEGARKMKQKMEEENGHRVWRNGGGVKPGQGFLKNLLRRLQWPQFSLHAPARAPLTSSQTECLLISGRFARTFFIVLTFKTADRTTALFSSGVEKILVQPGLVQLLHNYL